MTDIIKELVQSSNFKHALAMANRPVKFKKRIKRLEKLKKEKK